MGKLKTALAGIGALVLAVTATTGAAAVYVVKLDTKKAYGIGAEVSAYYDRCETATIRNLVKNGKGSIIYKTAMKRSCGMLVKTISTASEPYVLEVAILVFEHPDKSDLATQFDQLVAKQAKLSGEDPKAIHKEMWKGLQPEALDQSEFMTYRAMFLGSPEIRAIRPLPTYGQKAAPALRGRSETTQTTS